MPRVQAIVLRKDQILMVRHLHAGKIWWCLPGGAQELGETPEQGTLRELREECNVQGTIIRCISHMTYDSGDAAITFLVDIGDQTPALGYDPDVDAGQEALVDVNWMKLSEIPARDRTFLWTAGLLGTGAFLAEVERWGNALSYPLAAEMGWGDWALKMKPEQRGCGSIEFRILREEDIENVHACMDSIAREGVYLIRRSAPPLGAFRSFMLDKLASDSPCIVAVDGELIAGYCDVSPLKPEGFTHVAKLGMGVLQSHRRRGIGTMLLSNTMAEAARMGLERVELEVFASNHIAFHLYQRFGFQVEGIKQRIRKSEHGYDDLLQMAVFLDAPGESQKDDRQD